VDAWGTVTLPGIGTVDCLRVNTELVNELTDVLADPPVPLGTSHVRQYVWIAEGVGVVARVGSPFGAESIPDPGFTTAESLQVLVDFTPAPEGPQFIRGEVNGDENYNVSDAVGILRHLTGFAPVGCEAAADVDGNGEISVSDAVHSLRFLFARGPAPAAPFPACGVDAATELSCEESGC